MSLALSLRSILGPLFLAVVPATALAAVPDVKCAVTGAWSTPSAEVVTLHAEVGLADDALSHALAGKLIGGVSGGAFVGELTPMALDATEPKKPLLPLRYELAGAYSRGTDGQLYVSADVLLDLRQIGLVGYVKTGELSGVLRVVQIEPATVVSVPRAGDLRTMKGGLLESSVPKAVAVTKRPRPVARGGIFLASLQLFE